MYFRKMNLFKIILSPLALLYCLSTSFRNSLFNWGLLKQYRSSIPTLSIGNLSMGGTGKTPHVAFVLENTSNINTAVISRGYRRQSKKLIEGNKMLHSSKDLGDEPMELLEKFDGDDFKMIVEGNRAKALKYLEQQDSRTDLVVLDDGFQHQYAQRDLNVLLTEFNKPFYQDFILPMGTLRERRKGANRADIIIVTKCPENISQDDQKEIKTQITTYSSAKVLFSRIKYKGFLDRAEKDIKLEQNKMYLLVTGIANPNLIYKHLQDHNIKFESMKFADHHNFTSKELDQILKKSKNYNGLITTEKDWMRLREYPNITTSTAPIFRLKIGIEFINEEQNNEFNTQLNSLIHNPDN